MIISRTPYRISLFGGGTDYRSWYCNHGGAVLSTTINRYCYLNARWLPPFHAEKSRVVWSKIEAVQNNGNIEHPAVRACLAYLGISQGIEIHHTGDLPARSGLGSSSAFTVGLLNTLRALQGQKPTKNDLAIEAIHIERDVMKENVGIQDQIACAYGGINYVHICMDGRFSVVPLTLSQHHHKRLQDHLMLFFTGLTRTASDIAAEQVRIHQTGEKNKELREMQTMVNEAWDIVTRPRDWFNDLGRLLHESWLLKRSLAKNIAPQSVNEIYEKARKAGAMGGKLLGAGGGGFMLLFAEPEHHHAIHRALDGLLHVPFALEKEGSRIIINTPS